MQILHTKRYSGLSSEAMQDADSVQWKGICSKQYSLHIGRWSPAGYPPGVNELCLLVPPLAFLVLNESNGVESIVSGQRAIKSRSWIISRIPGNKTSFQGNAYSQDIAARH